MSDVHPDSPRAIPMPAGPATRGVVFIHACRRAFAPHVESVLHSALGPTLRIDWVVQPVLPGMWCADIAWRGPAGSAAAAMSQMLRFPDIHVEATQEPTASTPGMRYALAPDLGLWSCAMDAHGNVMLNEAQIRLAMQEPSGQVSVRLAHLLGEPWDAVLEPLRAGAQRPAAPLVRVV